MPGLCLAAPFLGMTQCQGVSTHVNPRVWGLNEMFGVLGPLEIILIGVQVPLPRRAKERCLLAVLLMEPNRKLTTEQLVYRVWDESDPLEKVRATFRSYMSHVRDVLETPGSEARLESSPDGYLLRIDRELIDLHRFRRLRDQAYAMAASGDAQVAASLLRDAEQLWRGPALAGLLGRWVDSARASLDEERRAAVLKRVGLDLELGRHDYLAGELRQMSAEYPTDEMVLGYAMTAFYRSGRQADALSLFHAARDHLVNLGLEPTPALSALHNRILRHDPSLALAPARLRRPAANHLPPRAPNFVGRAEQIKELTSARDREEPKIKIIHGMGGLGKTALAIQASRQVALSYPDGQLFVTFHSHHPGEVPLDTTEAARRLLEMTGMSLSSQSRGPRELFALWQQELTSTRMIIVLDDVPGVEAVTPLLPDSGDCLVIITSRSRLRLPGSFTMSLDMLPLQDAVTLFTRTAGTGNVDDSHALTRAVRLCGGLPLAIGLAATRLREDGSSAISEFADTLAELHARCEGPLAAAFEMSYQGLTTTHQSVFRYLGMSPCPDFTAATTAAIADISEPEAERILSDLFECHLLEQAAPRRFRLHDLLKAFADSCSREHDSDGERRSSILRLADYLQHNADRADRLLYPLRERIPSHGPRSPVADAEMGSPTEARGWLELEWRNTVVVARYAAEHEWHSRCAEIAHILAEFLDIRGCQDEAISLHSLAVRAYRDVADRAGIARASLDLGLAYQQRGDYKAALRHATEAQTISRETGDLRGQALAAGRIGSIYYYSGRLREALAYDQEARAFYSEAGDKNGEADAIFHHGTSSLDLGRVHDSIDNFNTALELFKGLGNERGLAKTLNSIAEVKRRQGFHREALQGYQEALSIYHRLGARQKQAVVEQNIGTIYLYKRQPDKALRLYRSALETYQEANNLPSQARALCDIGEAYLYMGRHDESLIHYERAEMLARKVGDASVRVLALRGLGDIHRQTDDPDEAMKWYGLALKLEYEVEDPYQQAKILEGMAETMLRTGRLDRGRIYLREAHDLFKASGSIDAESIQLRLRTLSAL